MPTLRPKTGLNQCKAHESLRKPLNTCLEMFRQHVQGSAELAAFVYSVNKRLPPS